jgi:segregation and condensation protein A
MIRLPRGMIGGEFGPSLLTFPPGDALSGFIHQKFTMRWLALTLHLPFRCYLRRTDMETTCMENISPLLSATQRPFDTNAAHRHPGQVVMISSHPGWPARRELHDDDAGGGETAADTVHLTRVFHEALERVRQGPVLNMDDESVTIGQMIDQIWQRFTVGGGPIRLTHILRHARSERATICTFLALLELVRLDAIVLRQDRNLSDILVKRNSELTG